MAEEYWLVGDVDLHDGLTTDDVQEALHAPGALRHENRLPVRKPSLLAVCAPTKGLRLIVVFCKRADPWPAWLVVAARDATMVERAMWRERTS